MKQVKIGILGEIRAGKDTVSELITKNLWVMDSSIPTKHFAFSTGIHDVIQLTMPELYQNGKPRQALQHIGQSLREIKPDVWIDYLIRSGCFNASRIGGHHMIVTDVRQPNEVERLQELGFHIIKVTASQEVRMQRALQLGDNFNPEMFNHETETIINSCDYDYLIDNSYSVDSLEKAVKMILKEVLSHE